MQKTRVAVLRGGPSEEYDVSLQTGGSVLEAIDSRKYDASDIVITKAGEWLHNGRIRNPEEILQGVDVVFVGLHGTYGEDGTVQRLMNKLGVRYTGSGAFQSAIAMNKVMTKDRLRDYDIKMAPHMLVTRETADNISGVVSSIGNMFGPKYVVKPIGSGSSVGVEVVENIFLLHGVLQRLLQTYDQIVVEKHIAGKEATCGVINNFREQNTYVLPPIEIVPPEHAGYFDRTVKYDGSTAEICPGRFTSEQKQEIERIARIVHETLELSQYSRSDFIVAPEGIYFLEVNTLPGMTPESLMPKALTAVGSTYESFVDHLLTDALNRPLRSMS